MLKAIELTRYQDSATATPRPSSPAPAAEAEDEGSCGVCGKAWDGEDDEETWIGCEEWVRSARERGSGGFADRHRCDQWFCAGCSGLTAEQIDLVEVFICKTCERRKSPQLTYLVVADRFRNAPEDDLESAMQV